MNVFFAGYSDLFCLAKRDLWETLGDYPEARASLTERGCQLLRKDGLLDEELFASKWGFSFHGFNNERYFKYKESVFCFEYLTEIKTTTTTKLHIKYYTTFYRYHDVLGASTVQETLTDGIIKLEKSLENLNVRLARLLAEYSASQAKMKQRMAKLEIWYG